MIDARHSSVIFPFIPHPSDWKNPWVLIYL